MVKIRKRITKHGKIYYYLEHSIRRGNKVIKKEKYLGTSIPKNIEEIKRLFSEKTYSGLYKKFHFIKHQFQARWKTLPKSVKEKELEEISIAFTYNTNAIEGSTITLEETRSIIHDHFAPNKSLKDVKETEAHSKVFLQMLQKKDRISDKTLLKWHKEIFEETKRDIAGAYRTYLVRVGYYIAPDWKQVKTMMHKLISFIKDTKENPVILAAIAHYRFEKIHPFGDGNGRIGRLLMNHILWKAGYPMIIIEYKKRSSYYKALSKDEEGFVRYFTRRYLTVHKKKAKNI